MSIPHYKQLHQLLKQQILTGTFQEGALLPSENELCATHHITRATVRQALDELVKEKLIYKHRGKGSVVSPRRKSLGLLSFKGFSEVVGASHTPVNTEILHKPTIQPWPEDFFYPLSEREIEVGCIYLERLRFADNHPVMLEYTYIPTIDLSGFLEYNLGKDSLFETLHVHYNLDIINVEQDIRAIVADKNTTDQLGLMTGAPVLHIYRRYGTNRTDFYIYSSLYCNTTHYALSNSFDS
ncbi:GntR family transcriptional regulator [Xanthocytophaga agilis]|uniref:GntR family transcriptional regulator n=1 Tax=Xanthocytophaga agilis TaxID=3048010 RepID=A0AAE3R9K9_9BACT|nr:GntR family transcriptional regulator [Xanthocytophaga agilis]MDJ1504010.1 GntR family transcriptional regulator [Xanthocytophaga agilis]